MSQTDNPDAPKRKWTKGGPSRNPGGKRKRPPEPAQPEVAQPESNGRNKDGTFAKGSTPNPAGRPKGSFNKATLAALRIMEADAEIISLKCVELAKAGDLTAIKLILDRLVSPARDRPVRLELPKIGVTADLVAAAARLTEAAGSGEITPGEAASLGSLVGNVAKVIETHELAERIAALEGRMGKGGGQ